MTHKVAVFGASGRIGQAQVRQLSLSGYKPVAVTRHPEALNHDDFSSAEMVAADFDDPESIAAVLAAVDAVFFQLPTMASPVDAKRYARNFAGKAREAGKRVIMNTTMWAPDGPPSGVAMYDFARTAEDILVDAGLEMVIFRPTIMMESLLTVLWKPSMVNEGVARYAQRPGLRANWISTDDIAKFMIEGLHRTDLNGRRIPIGGPEALTVEEVVNVVADNIGRPVRYEYVPPRQYGIKLFHALAETADPTAGPGLLGENEDDYAEFYEKFYDFNNHSPLRPLEVDVDELLEQVPVTLTRLRKWAAAQDWVADRSGVASILG
jgi:uncharacterized protein YbjT (DUF2867 family)